VERMSGFAVRRPRAAIIANSAKIDIEALKREVRRQELAHGWDFSLWFETSLAESGESQARAAAAAGVSLVVAVGGDGTVRAVSDALTGLRMTLAIVPAGTGNLLARNLGIPLGDPATALSIAFSGRSRRIDVGRLALTRQDGTVGQHSFLVIAGMGLDAKMIETTKPELKRRVGWLAYVEAIVRILAKPTTLNTRYSIDGSPEKTATINTLLIGNCGTVQGHFRLLPDAQLDDGRLDYVALRSLDNRDQSAVARWLWWENTWWRRGRRARGVRSTMRDTDSFRYGQASRLQVWLEHPERFEVDGDDVGDVTGVEAWVDAGALSVRIDKLPRRN
jgi:diacylglycerol kinase (ATP)